MSDTRYTGRDNLDIMSLAINYNSNIYKWLSKGINNNSAVLDYGAGQGEFFYRFEQYYESVIAIEIDSEMHVHFPNRRVFSSISELKEEFDLIYSVNVLEHIKDDASAVNSFKKYLKARESVVKVFVPARQELYNEMDAKVGHYRRYSKKQLTKLFHDNGYDILSCQYFDFLGYFATALYKILGKKGEINPESLIFYDKYIFPISLMFDKIFSGFLGKNIVLEAKLRIE